MFSVEVSGPLPFWEDPTQQHRNRLPPSTLMAPLESVPKMFEEPLVASPWSRLLNGIWDFRLARGPWDLPEGWNLPGPVADFHPLPVPSSWQMEGYGHPHYTNIPYPIPFDPPHVPVDNPTGLYRRSFTVPAEWNGRRVHLRLGGVDSCFLFWINGREVGASKGSHLESVFDLTDSLVPGANLLAIMVLKWSDGTYLEDQDKWRLSGIFRDVELISRAPAHLQDVRVRTPALGAECQDFALEVDVHGGAGTVAALAAELRTSDGSVVANLEFGTVAAGSIVTRRVELASPRRWTAETPELYSLVVISRDTAGIVSEVHHIAVGFREICIRDRSLWINGQRVKLQGVNRHDAHPDLGSVMTRSDLERDLKRMKQCHVNTIRTSHYPPDRYCLELADRHGLYVIDESDLECHGCVGRGNGNPTDLTYFMDHPDWKDAILDRLQRMMGRDRNHPSIIAWSMGNENGFGPNLSAAIDWARKEDPSRFIHSEDSTSGYRPFFGPESDVFSRMYTSAEDLDSEKEFKNDNRPFFLCEYAHSMGNAAGSLADYWRLIRSRDHLIGGCIWEWADHGIRNRRLDGSVRNGDGRGFSYGGDFGDTPNDVNFCIDGISGSDREDKPGLLELKQVYAPIEISQGTSPQTVCIHNHQDFLGFDHLEVRWIHRRDGHVHSQGRLPLPNVPPHGKAEVDLPLKPCGTASSAHEVVDFTVTQGEEHYWAPAGHLVAVWQVEFPRTSPVAPPPRVAPLRQVSTTAVGWELRADDAVLVFDRVHGTPISWKVAGAELLARSPGLAFWRAPTDNDRGGWPPVTLYSWHGAGLDRLWTRTSAASLEESDGRAVITVEQVFGAVGKDSFARARLVWTFAGDGSLEVSVQVTPLREDLESLSLPRIGLKLELPSTFDRLTWYGRGPGDDYPDRQSASRIGRWQSTVQEQHVPWVRPQEHGHHSACRWFSVADARGQMVTATSAVPFGASALAYTPEELTAKRHDHELVASGTTVWHLDAGQNGLGNASCGPVPMERYRLKAAPMEFGFRLVPGNAQASHPRG